MRNRLGRKHFSAAKLPSQDGVSEQTPSRTKAGRMALPVGAVSTEVLPGQRLLGLPALPDPFWANSWNTTPSANRSQVSVPLQCDKKVFCQDFKKARPFLLVLVSLCFGSKEEIEAISQKLPLFPVRPGPYMSGQVLPLQDQPCAGTKRAPALAWAKPMASPPCQGPASSHTQCPVQCSPTLGHEISPCISALQVFPILLTRGFVLRAHPPQ